jgi:hypothetical protein
MKTFDVIEFKRQLLEISQILGLHEGAITAIKYGKHKLK